MLRLQKKLQKLLSLLKNDDCIGDYFNNSYVQFGEYLKLASIEDVNIEGETPFEKHFVINKADKEKFLDEIYFFFVDNNMDSVLHERYRAN